jgi:hypothetical protein
MRSVASITERWKIVSSMMIEEKLKLVQLTEGVEAVHKASWKRAGEDDVEEGPLGEWE